MCRIRLELILNLVEGGELFHDLRSRKSWFLFLVQKHHIVNTFFDVKVKVFHLRELLLSKLRKPISLCSRDLQLKLRRRRPVLVHSGKRRDGTLPLLLLSSEMIPVILEPIDKHAHVSFLRVAVSLAAHKK